MDRESARRDLRGRMETFLRRCEAQRLEPDRWEAHWMTVAIAHLGGGDFEAGVAAMRHVELPKRLRIDSELPATARALTVAQLRSLLAQFGGDVA